MESQTFNLWDNTPGLCEEIPTITHYKPKNPVSNAAFVILPGGGYHIKAPHEGKGYAEFLANNGYNAFVVIYRTAPHSFPLPLLDSRRSMRYVRYYADKFGISKEKIAIMGSSAGGHLAALTSTYTKSIDFEGLDDIDKEDFIPNKQILCYPVINLYNKTIAHIGSGNNLLGSDNYLDNNSPEYEIKRKSLSPNLLVNEATPGAFIWHTANDTAVDSRNSYEYAAALRGYGIDVEMHIFPHGNHGLGLTDKSTPEKIHVSQWSDLMLSWIKYIGW